jgi:hypothetical protein
LACATESFAATGVIRVSLGKTSNKAFTVHAVAFAMFVSFAFGFFSCLHLEERTVCRHAPKRPCSAGYAAAAAFIKTDWKGWGDLRFDFDHSHVLSSGEVGWVASIGSIRFKNGERPVRFTPIVTREPDRWPSASSAFSGTTTIRAKPSS